MTDKKRRVFKIAAAGAGVLVIVLGAACGIIYLSNARVDRLVDGLGHHDESVRHEAVAGLFDMRGALVIERLIEAVEADDRVTQRSLYAEALLAAMGEEAFEYLFADSLIPTRERSTWLPRSLGGAVATGRRRTTVDRLLRQRVLVAFEDRGLAALAPKLKSRDRITVGTAVALLPVCRQSGELLAPLAAHRDEATRRAVLEKIRDSRAFNAAPSVLPLLDDPVADIRSLAAATLGELRNPIAVEPLCAALEDRELTRHAATALRKIGDAGAADALLALLEDKTDYDASRATAAMALAEIDDRRAIAPLVACLPKDMDETHGGDLPAVAAMALGRLGGPEAVEALRKVVVLKARDHEHTWPPAVRGLIETGDKAAIDAARRHFGPYHVFADAGMIKLLVDLGKSDAVMPIAGILRNTGRGPTFIMIDFFSSDITSTETCVAAAEALGELGDPRGFEPLMEVVLSKGDPVRPYAIRALGVLGDERAVLPLMSIVQERYDRDRGEALKALARFDPPEFRALLMRILTEAASMDVRELLVHSDLAAEEIEAKIDYLESRNADLPAGFIRVVEEDYRGMYYEANECAAMAAGMLEAAGGQAEVAAVDVFSAGVDVAAMARDYRQCITAGRTDFRFYLPVILERHGTFEMAADLYRCGNGDLAACAVDWADRRGRSADLEAAKDSPDRPLWPRALSVGG